MDAHKKTIRTQIKKFNSPPRNRQQNLTSAHNLIHTIKNQHASPPSRPRAKRHEAFLHRNRCTHAYSAHNCCIRDGAHGKRHWIIYRCRCFCQCESGKAPSGREQGTWTLNNGRVKIKSVLKQIINIHFYYRKQIVLRSLQDKIFNVFREFGHFFLILVSHFEFNDRKVLLGPK